MPVLDRAVAELWLDRWDAQQERYVADREERFAVITDLVREATGDAPTVLDLGCGPGSLSARVRSRLPGARVIGVDADPLLLALARARYPEISFADADLTDQDWPRKAGVPDEVDAVVSTTALHWMPRDALEALYGRLGELVRPGGVFVNGDHLNPGTEGLNRLARHVRKCRAERAGVTGNEEWQAWWDAVQEDARLAELVDERSRRAIEHDGGNDVSVTEHADLLRKAGFSEVGVVWQSGDDTVLVAVR